jgi:uncharacterized protein YoxC
MADLRVENATLVHAQSTFRTAGDRLAPVVPALQGLNSDVVGAATLAQKLHEAHGILASDLGIIGQALTELAAHASEISTAFGHVDQALTQEARAAR